ncbi:MAG TPA: PIN domain-containing protein [Solirubrobacterales bacterium]|nr:PIN domain-containing protein [Solirubrobacterales bacterium]
MTKAVADTSIFIAQETGRELGDLPEKIAVSVITVAELELGVLRATDTGVRARRLSTLSRVQSVYPLLPIGPEVASCFARIAASERARGRRLRRHDTWIAATAMHHRAAVFTQDGDFTSFDGVEVIRA